MKKNKKIIAILMILCTFIGSFQSCILAKSVGDSAYIYDLGRCDYNVQFNFGNSWNYVITHYVVYNENGRTYPAYCMNKDLPGVGETDGYDVDLVAIMDNNEIWRTATNGFPYKSATELGVENDFDAFFATKHALYSILYNRNPADLYRGTDERGQKIVNAIINLTNIGRYGTATQETVNIYTNKVGGIVEENDYYSQTYAVNSNITMSEYTITATANMPVGSYIADSNGNKKDKFNAGENFKVMIPKSSMKQDIDAIINVQGKCKSYSVFYGETTVSGTQNYLITTDPFGDYSGRANLKIAGNTSSLKLKKIDKETGKGLSGVTFEVKDEKGVILGDYTTDNLGYIEINNLYPQTLTLREKATRDDYILNSEEKKVTLEWTKTSTITFENIHKKGNLKIVKVDADNHELTLGGIEFDLVYPDGTTYNLITDADGCIKLDNINIGNATLIEKRTKKEYKLNEEQEIKIEWNETTDLMIENEKYKAQIEIYKTDAENKEWKLPEIEFDILDKDKNYIQTITTDENGYAITDKIPLGDKTGILYAREKKTDDLHILNDELVKVNLEADTIYTLHIENERIKGKIEIYKTSEDNNFINGLEAGSPIKDVEFDIYDLDNNCITSLTTDENGYAITDLLDKKIYKVIEKKSGEWYLLDTTEHIAEIVNNRDVITLNITNVSEKPSVDIEKDGIIQTTANQEIKYDFSIKNSGNTKLDKFTWYDYLPTDYIRITKLVTGTYNQDLNYSIYYKTNKNDYKLLRENLNTQNNNYIDFSDLKLDIDEYVTEFKADFGTVDIGFKSIINPYIFAKVNSNVQDNDTFINRTRIEGYNKTYLVWDEDDHTTKVYEKKIDIKKLPRTGM